MSRRIAACGTYTGYQRHWRAGEPPCQPCRDARAAWQRDHRRPDDGSRAAYSRAYTRAKAALVRLHRGDFARLLDEERNRAAEEQAGSA